MSAKSNSYLIPCLYVFLFTIISVIPVNAFGQGHYDKTEPDSLERWYRMSRRIEIEKIEREHIPLDGDEVSMIPFRESKKFGFVDKGSGKLIIQPQYDQVFAVYREGAIVQKEERYGLVDSNNKLIIGNYYENLLKEGDLYHGMIFGVIDTNLSHDYYRSFILNQYYNEKGQFIFTEEAHDQQTFLGDDTLAWFRYGKTYTIRSKTGKVWKKFRHDEKDRFVNICDNLLIYRKEQGGRMLYSAYDIKGKLQFRIPFSGGRVEGIFKLSEDLFGLVLPDADYLFCDGKGQIKPYGRTSFAVGFFISDMEYFDKDIFIVKDHKKETYGVINRKGEILVDFKYRWIDQFVNDIAFCTDTTKARVGRFIDKGGRIVLDSVWLGEADKHFRSLGLPIGFYESLCIGRTYKILKEKDENGIEREYIDDDSTFFYYFDTTGKAVLMLTTDIRFAGVFSGGLAPAVNHEGALGFIDTQGRFAILPEYELAAAGAYPFPYLVVPEFINGYAYIKSFKGYIDKNGKRYFAGERLKDHYNFSH